MGKPSGALDRGTLVVVRDWRADVCKVRLAVRLGPILDGNRRMRKHIRCSQDDYSTVSEDRADARHRDIQQRGYGGCDPGAAPDRVPASPLRISYCLSCPGIVRDRMALCVVACLQTRTNRSGA